MSMVQQLIQAVTAAQRQIDDQVTKLQAYNGQVDPPAASADQTAGFRYSRKALRGKGKAHPGENDLIKEEAPCHLYRN